ncbi:MAG: ATP-binding protein [bacterium]|jgi:NAD-dependent dihydropyrimidine dehydrogenase PreA subunit
MQLFNKNNKRALLNKFSKEIIPGIEVIFKRAQDNGVNNLFYDENINHLLPEILDLSSVKKYLNIDSLWFSIYGLSVTRQRSFVICNADSFFSFSQLENLFLKSNQFYGGILIFILNRDNFNNFSSETEKKFPIFNYSKLDEFIDLIPSKFQLSEKLKLPIIVYLNSSILLEYKIYESDLFTERTETKSVLKTADNFESVKNKFILPENYEGFKNFDNSIEFISNDNSDNLILCDSKAFPEIIEKFSNYNIIYFKLLNPVDIEKLKSIFDKIPEKRFENILIYDSYQLLSKQLYLFFKNNSKIKFNKLNLINSNYNSNCNSNCEGKNGDEYFYLENFIPAAMPSYPSFCIGCNLFAFLQKMNKINNKNIVLIGDNNCFSLISSSPLKFSFPDLFLIKEPIYFISNLDIKNLNKQIYVFISYSNLLNNIDLVANKINNLTSKEKIYFVIYNSIYDYYNDSLKINNNNDYNLPQIKNIKSEILKNNLTLHDFKDQYKTNLIFIEDDCLKKTKGVKNYNFYKYLRINNDICLKFECKLCFQTTGCSAIKIEETNNFIIDPVTCTNCKLCIEICPHNAIKIYKKKKIKIKESIENKINLKKGKKNKIT